MLLNLYGLLCIVIFVFVIVNFVQCKNQPFSCSFCFFRLCTYALCAGTLLHVIILKPQHFDMMVMWESFY